MDIDYRAVAEAIDRLSTLEMRSRGSSTGVIPRLYHAARRGGEPISLVAATLLKERIGPGDRVILVTGAGCAPHLPFGETDGPPGVAALSRVFSVGIKARPIVLAERHLLDPIKAACSALGLRVVPSSMLDELPFAVSVEEWSVDVEQKVFAERLVADFEPKCIVSVEKIGPNAKGVKHYSSGKALPDSVFGEPERLFDLAKSSSIATIGIGDNGNEIGFGNIEKEVRIHKKFGDKCLCPCQSGIACSTEADVLVVGGTSNWGAYGVAAMLSLLLGNAESFHSPELETRQIQACCAAGAVCGSTGMSLPDVDGTPLRLQRYLVDILHVIMSNAMKQRDRGF